MRRLASGIAIRYHQCAMRKLLLIPLLLLGSLQALLWWLLEDSP